MSASNPDLLFTVGRAQLANGPHATPFPSSITQLGNNRIRITGTYTPRPESGDTTADLLVKAQAFMQQWVGLQGEPDAVPLVSEAQPQLTGVYDVVSSSVDWVQALTTEEGHVNYSATLDRLEPSGVGAATEAQYVTTSRSTATHAVTAQPVLWAPDAAYHSELDPTLTADFIGADGAGSGLSGEEITGPAVDSFRFGMPVADYYTGACRIEVRYPGSVDWFPVVGRQITTVSPDDLRITNGVVRQTFAADGTVTLDRATESGGVYSWLTVEVFEMWMYNLSSKLFPADGGMSIQRNSPESVSVKWSIEPINSRSSTVTATINRGNPFATWVLPDLSIYDPIPINTIIAVAPTVTVSSSLIVGGAEADTAVSGHKWVIAYPGTISTVGVGIYRVLDLASKQSFGLGATAGAGTDLVDQWWAATATTERFVSQ